MQIITLLLSLEELFHVKLSSHGIISISVGHELNLLSRIGKTNRSGMLSKYTTNEWIVKCNTCIHLTFVVFKIDIMYWKLKRFHELRYLHIKLSQHIEKNNSITNMLKARVSLYVYELYIGNNYCEIYLWFLKLCLSDIFGLTARYIIMVLATDNKYLTFIALWKITWNYIFLRLQTPFRRI